MKVWIVGKFKDMSDEHGMAWEFQGVFSTEEKAVAACKEALWFVAPVLVDVELPIETAPWPGFYYPAEKE